MLIEIIFFVLLGVLFGIFSGLVPGIHVNLVGVFLIYVYGKIFYFFNEIYFLVFIVAMAITHSFLDFIPSIFLGCPDTDTELSVLPGHELLKQGKGYEAILLTAYGSAGAILILILFCFPLIFILGKSYFIIQKVTPYVLILISVFLIASEKKKFSGAWVFLLTGILGFLVLGFENFGQAGFSFLRFEQPLFPLLTGLFGASMLVISIKNKIEIPEQKIKIPRTRMFKPLLGAFIAAPFCSFLPGVGSGQAAIIGSVVARAQENKKQFLVLLGATNTLVMGFSFVFLYAISRARTGAALVVQEIFGQINFQSLILILIVIIFSGAAGFFLTLFFAKYFSEKISNLNYGLISIFVLVFLIFLVWLVSGILGVLVLGISTLTGIYCIKLNVRRTLMMGCLMVPVVLGYFGF